jgi:hypothetical protein
MAKTSAQLDAEIAATLATGRKPTGDRRRRARQRGRLPMISARLCAVCGEEIEPGHETSAWHLAHL